VFRDATSLSASPELWPTIEEALRRSSYFVLVASPDAARSVWVEQEIAWWRAHRSSATLLIVLSDGELRWDELARDFSAESAVPPSVRGWLSSEPLWVDLRWARAEAQVSPRDPRFRDAAASLAARIRGVAKDELVGEDVRQHRRTILVARAAVAVLGVLTVTAVIAALTARREARQATSLALTSTASSLLNSRPDVSLLLAFEAYRLSERPEAHSGLVQAFTAVRATGALAKLTGQALPVQRVAFSPDGHTVASASSWVAFLDGAPAVWLRDLRTRRRVGPPLEVEAVGLAFSPDGRTLGVATTDHTVGLWDLRTRSLRKLPVAPGRPFGALAFSPDGRRVAAGGDDEVAMVWDVARPDQPPTMLMFGHTGAIHTLAFSPDGEILASGGDDKTIRLWDLDTGSQVAEPLVGHTGSVTTVAFSADRHTLASGSQFDGTLRLWDLRRHRQRGAPLVAGTDEFHDVAFSPDGRTLAAAGDDGTIAAYDGDGLIRLWSVGSRPKLLRTLPGHTGTVNSVAFSPDGRTLISGGNDQTVGIWDIRAEDERNGPLLGHAAPVNSVAISSDGRTLASGSDDETIRLWDIRAREPIGRPLRGHRAAVTSVSFSSDGRLLASAGADRSVRLWDARTHTPIAPALTSSAPVTSVTFSPDGRSVASIDDDDRIRVWSVRTHKLLDEWPVFLGPARSLAFTPDGRTLIFPDGDGIENWDIRRRTEDPETTSLHRGSVFSVDVSPDGHLIASAGEDQVVRLWELPSYEELTPPLAGHTAPIRSVAFSPDGGRLAASGDDGTIRVWDVDSRRPLGEPLTGHRGAVNSVVFSPRGDLLASGGRDHSIRLWSIPAWRTETELKASVCALVGDGLSEDEWDQYAAGLSYRLSCP
jgi:WD40 repeat protein